MHTQPVVARRLTKLSREARDEVYSIINNMKKKTSLSMERKGKKG
jgi:hypothetical protein